MGGNPAADGTDGPGGVEGAASDLTAVYRLRDEGGRLLYVGASAHPARRLARHRRRDWWPSVATIEVTWHPDRLKASASERGFIDQEAPTYNRAGLEAHYSRPGGRRTGASQQHGKRRPRVMSVRTTSAERAELLRAASADGMALGTWLRRQTLEAAVASVARQKRQADTNTAQAP